MSSTPPKPRVSIIIPTRNRNNKLARCLDSVRNSDYSDVEVIVVDDASETPVSEVLSKRFPSVRFIRNGERMLLSYSRNSGAAAASGDYLFFLDDDNVLASDTIRLLAETLGRSERVAVSSPIIFYLSRPTTVWTSYISRSKFPGFYTLHTDIPSDEVLTFSFHNSFMVKRKVFDELHGFDYHNLPIRFGEVDFAHRVNAGGYVAVVNPRAKDWHDLGWTTVHIDSTRAYYTERNRIIIIKRYFKKRDLTFYYWCILPFLSAFFLLHHPLSTTDGRIKTASSFLRGVVAGLMFEEPEVGQNQSGARGGDTHQKTAKKL
jgi:GT2 family glycosyltransferase